MSPFERPVLWVFLLLLIPLGIGLAALERRRREDGSRLVLPEWRPFLGLRRTDSWVRVGLLLGAVGCFFLALFSPRERPYTEFDRAQRDILVVVDTSWSMAAEDLSPSRMQVAREAIRALLQRLQGERIGVVAFAGRAVLQSPLTRDYGAVRTLVDSLTPGVVPPGTALREALWMAMRAFSDDSQRARLVLLITDGEDQDTNPYPLAAQLREANIALFVLGVGTEEGAPIPLRDERGTLTGYKRDRAGRLVTTRMNAQLLEELARRAGGRLVFASDRRALERLLDEMVRPAAPGAQRRRWGRAEILALFGLFLWLLEGWWGSLSFWWLRWGLRRLRWRPASIQSNL